MNEAERIQAMREGGQVKRHHTTATIGEETNAEHTWNCVNLLLTLHPDPSADLVRAMQWHDIPERWTGDIPSPVKRAVPGMAEAVESMECDLA